jgi:hypothetical protein
VPGLAAPAQPSGWPPGGDNWDGDGDDWDPAESLTAAEIAALAALDRAGDPVDDWQGEPGDLGPVDVDAWLDGPPGDGPYPPPGDGPCPPTDAVPGKALLGAGPAEAPPGDGPAEALPGLTPRRLGTGGGFDAGGLADQLPPGPVLAGLTADRWAAGLSGASDDELAGLMIAWRRVASWAAAGELSAVAELCRRREAQVVAGADPHLAEHISDEVAMVLRLTSWAADRLVDQAEGLARLPRTMAALAAGEIDVPKALVILGELSGLGDVHAARVEAAVTGRAAEWTTGELRRAAHLQVIAADPAAARRRKERAAKQARVERWAEDAGTAALAGRDLPPAEVLAADALLTAWAKRLRDAGLDGNLDQVRAQVYLALLNGQPPETLLPIAARDQGNPGAASAQGEPAGTTTSGQSGPAAGTTTSAKSRPAAETSTSAKSRPTPGRPHANAGHGEAATASAPAALSARGSVNLVLPLPTWLGWSASPGEVAGFGPLDATDSRTLAAALARDPATKWCVTVTGSDGRAVAHGCAKGDPGQPPTDPLGPGGGPGPPPPPRMRAWLASITLAWLETGECSHRRESPGYRPSRSLTHLIQVRQVTCTAPGCRRPATSCDFEHTIPFHQGGRSCECNGGPCCRRHHRAKQAVGWALSQPCPGTFVWTTPHGRTYQTEPRPYPV